MNKKFISQQILTKMTKLSSRMVIIVNILDKIEDSEKFKYLAEVKLLIFSLKFEGFGLPPVEAQFMNTPVICSDLPVFKRSRFKS